MNSKSKKEYLMFKLYNELHHLRVYMIETDDLGKILDRLETTEDVISELKVLYVMNGKG